MRHRGNHILERLSYVESNGAHTPTPIARDESSGWGTSSASFQATQLQDRETGIGEIEACQAPRQPGMRGPLSRRYRQGHRARASDTEVAIEKGKGSYPHGLLPSQYSVGIPLASGELAYTQPIIFYLSIMRSIHHATSRAPLSPERITIRRCWLSGQPRLELDSAEQSSVAVPLRELWPQMRPAIQAICARHCGRDCIAHAG